MIVRLMIMEIPIEPTVSERERSGEKAKSQSRRTFMSIKMASIWKCVPIIPHTWKS